MVMRYQIVKYLADGHFHSGEEMADKFGVSRAAIWKHLSMIREQLGLEVFAVRGRGYRLSNPIELLDEAIIDSKLSELTRSRVAKLEMHASLDSTNSYLMGRSVEGADSGHVCLAEQQLAGRGRRGREWISPFGSNIYLSILWHYPQGPAGLSGLSLAAGVAVVQTLKQMGVEEVGLKWPNDVLCGNRKLAGLLLEVAGEQEGPSRVVLGLGLNTRLTQGQGKMIDQPWIDLVNTPGGEGISRNSLVAGLLDNLLESMSGYGHDDLASLVDEWRHYDLYHGKAVTLQIGNRTVGGMHRGIDSSGALLLEENGKISSYHGGEISLRLR